MYICIDYLPPSSAGGQVQVKLYLCVLSVPPAACNREPLANRAECYFELSVRASAVNFIKFANLRNVSLKY